MLLEAKTEYEAPFQRLQEEVRSLTADNRNQRYLTKGWRAVVELYQKPRDYCQALRRVALLDVAEGTVSLSAPAKVSLLTKFSDRNFTGYDSGDDFYRDMIRLPAPGLFVRRNSAELSDTQHQRLEQHYGVSARYGGIRIPFCRIMPDGQKISMEMLIGFSGDNDRDDLFFTLQIARITMALFDEMLVGDFVFDWHGLEAATDPHVQLWYNQMANIYV